MTNYIFSLFNHSFFLLEHGHLPLLLLFCKKVPRGKLDVKV
jgi:hypothetical protein